MISFLCLIKMKKKKQNKKQMPAKLKDELSDVETYCVVMWSALKREVLTELLKYIPAAKTNKQKT